MQILAAFDALTIGRQIHDLPFRASQGEVHLFGYLACLMFLYKNQGIGATEWGYAFAATPLGAPFSEELHTEINRLVRTGYLTLHRNELGLTPAGISEQENLERLSLNASRLEFLEAATSSVLVLPPAVIRSALATDHDAVMAESLGKSRDLISPTAIPRLYQDFSALNDALGSSSMDLLSASVLWLTYLSNRSLPVEYQ